MDTPDEPPTAHQLPNEIKPTQPGPIDCKVQGITAKVSLNRPAEDLIPARFLKRAERTCTFLLLYMPRIIDERRDSILHGT